MKRKSVTRLALVSLGVVTTLLSSHIAFGNDAAVAGEAAAGSEAAVAEETKAEVKHEMFQSNGSAIMVDSLGIEITPPTGWDVRTNSLGMSLVMEAPVDKDAKIDYSKPTFRRNITVTTMHEGSPIDEKEAQRIKEKLVKDISQIGGISDFQLHGDHKFFNYRGENDGLMIYSTFVMNSFPMMQMHVFVSGSNNRSLLTYTDLAENFEKEATFAEAWASIVSIKVTGHSPQRYRDLLMFGVPAAVAILVIAGLLYRRRRSIYREFGDAEKELHSDEEVSGNDAELHTGVAAFSSVETPISGSWEGLSRAEQPVSAVEEFADASDNEVSEASGFGGLFARVSRKSDAKKAHRAAKSEHSNVVPLSGVSALSTF